MSENLIFTHNLKKLRTLKALCATALCVAATGFVVDLYILIAGYHAARRAWQIAWLLLYALWACVFFLWHRFYSARITTLTRSTNRPEPKPQ
jgi:ABC-type thiamin/hydroxymethylpyrimidine transport system permease subunit